MNYTICWNWWIETVHWYRMGCSIWVIYTIKKVSITWGYPKIMQNWLLSGKTNGKPMIWGYAYSSKPPYIVKWMKNWYGWVWENRVDPPDPPRSNSWSINNGPVTRVCIMDVTQNSGLEISGDTPPARGTIFLAFVVQKNWMTSFRISIYLHAVTYLIK